MADSGGSDWEVVSLTASTYAAAPGPLLPIHAAAQKTESPLLLLPPNPPAPPPHFFMSQHFNLPPLFTSTHLDLDENNNGSQELESVVADGDADHLHMPICPHNLCQTQTDDAALLLVSPSGNGLQVEGGEERDEPQRTTTPTSLPDAAAGGHVPAGSDAAADATDTLPPTLPSPAATVGVAAPSGGVGACNAAQAWWEKTFSFPRQDGNGNGNGTQPLAFRFVFVAGKLQLQEDHLSPVPEFDQTQKISCTGNEPLGQVKVSMLGGGGPVAQQG